jgi:TusA-related sulfurtransferase
VGYPVETREQGEIARAWLRTSAGSEQTRREKGWENGTWRTHTAADRRRPAGKRSLTFGASSAPVWKALKWKEEIISREAIGSEPAVELDLRGSTCPGPTGDTLAALKKLPAGATLVVISDYLPARQTIPRLVEQKGCSWQITEDDGKIFRMEITKGGE